MWNFQIPVVMFDSKTRRIVTVNAVAATLLESTEQELRGQLVDGCVIPEERDRLATSIGTIEPRWGEVGAWRCLTCKGNRFTAQIRFHQTMYEDKLVHIVLATEILPMSHSRAAAAGSSETQSGC
jgi:hypothetical protein